MQKWLDENYVLMYSTYEGKSVIADRFIRILESKVYKKMTSNDNKSCLSYLNKLIYQ